MTGTVKDLERWVRRVVLNHAEIKELSRLCDDDTLIASVYYDSRPLIFADTAETYLKMRELFTGWEKSTETVDSVMFHADYCGHAICVAAQKSVLEGSADNE